MLGAGPKIAKLVVSYGNIVFGGSILIVFNAAAYGILRAEGNVLSSSFGVVFLLVGIYLSLGADFF